VWSRSGLLNNTWIEKATVPTQGESTSWADPSVTPIRKFHKIELKRPFCPTGVSGERLEDQEFLGD